MAPIATQTQPWLRHVSFSYNLDQVALAVFRLGDDLKIAQNNIPILGNLLRGIRAGTMAALNTPALWGSMLALFLMLGLAAVIIGKRVKPE